MRPNRTVFTINFHFPSPLTTPSRSQAHQPRRSFSSSVTAAPMLHSHLVPIPKLQVPSNSVKLHMLRLPSSSSFLSGSLHFPSLTTSLNPLSSRISVRSFVRASAEVTNIRTIVLIFCSVSFYLH